MSKKRIMKNYFIFFALVFITRQAISQSPELDWVAGFGSASAFDSGNSVAVDAAGNVYTVGVFSDTVDFNPGPPVFDIISVSVDDIFVSKFDSTGNFIWAKSFSASNYQSANCITVDDSDNIFICGDFSGEMDFDPNAGNFNLVSNNQDAFILKLNSNGDFRWARKMGGNLYESVNSIKTDEEGNVYTTGFFTSAAADFDPGAGVFNLNNAANGADVFISKLDNNGDFIWAKRIGSSQEDNALSVFVDPFGIYITGFFASTADFDPGPDTFSLTSHGFNDIFILKLNLAGDFAWTKTIGGSLYDHSFAIATDPQGNVYSAGLYSDIVDFDPGSAIAYQTAVGGNDIFVAKFDGSGNFIWAASMGGESNEYANSIALDAVGNVYTTGILFSTAADFDPGIDSFTLAYSEGSAFVSILNVSGNFVWANNTGGLGGNGKSITADISGNLYVTGSFSNTSDFDPGPGVSNLVSNGYSDAFILKLKPATVAIGELDIQNNIVQYPNPFENTFNLKIPEFFMDCDVAFYNTTGMLVYKSRITKLENKIDLSYLPAGIFRMSISNNNKRFSKTIIKSDK